MSTPSLTKKQIRNLNRRFELGVYRKKTIADYPILHTYVANLLQGAHDQLLQGITVKLTLGQPWILNAPRMYEQVPPEFWLERLGAYKIEICKASTNYLCLRVNIPDKNDIFYPDSYVILTSLATCQIYVSDKGNIVYIDVAFDTKPPTFIRDLARDFSMGGPCTRRKLRDRIKRIGEASDHALLAPIKFGRAITIQVD